MRLYEILVKYENGGTDYYNIVGTSMENALSVLHQKVRNIVTVSICTDKGPVLIDERKDWT